MAGSLNNLGFVAYRRGDFGSAELYYKQSLEIRREFGNLQHIAQSLQGFAEAAAGKAAWERAVHLWGAADHLREQSGSPLPSDEQGELEADLASARRALGGESFCCAWEHGRNMDLNQSIDYAFTAA